MGLVIPLAIRLMTYLTLGYCNAQGARLCNVVLPARSAVPVRRGSGQGRGEFRVVFRFREIAATLWDGEVSEVATSSALSIDVRARRVLVNGTEVSLPRKEFDLLAFLYANRGKACSKDEIAQGAWAEEGGIVSQETIDTDVFCIRQRK
jgi:DNA-binding response OmpR family regulator